MATSPPTSIEHEYVDALDPAAMPPTADVILRSEAANPLAKLSRARTGFARAEIVQAFHTAFELIGGVPRMAVWADNNPGEFYKLYAKLLPASSQVDVTGEHKIVVQHVLPRPHDYKTDPNTVDADADDDPA